MKIQFKLKSKTAYDDGTFALILAHGTQSVKLEVSKECFNQVETGQWFDLTGLSSEFSASKTAGIEFVEQTPGYFPCEENLTTMVDYLSSHKAGVSVHALKAAYIELDKIGRLFHNAEEVAAAYRLSVTRR